MKNFKLKALFLGFVLMLSHNSSAADNQFKAATELACHLGVIDACTQKCSEYCSEKNTDAKAIKKCVSENCNMQGYCNIALMNGVESHPGTLKVQKFKIKNASQIPSVFREFADDYKKCLKEELTEGRNNKGKFTGKRWQED